MQDMYSDLKELSLKLFGDDARIEEHSSPKGIEIYIDLSSKGSQVKKIEVALYEDTAQLGFMHIDDFTFEYRPLQGENFTEIKKYLIAAAAGKLQDTTINFLGMKLRKRLVIKTGKNC